MKKIGIITGIVLLVATVFSLGYYSKSLSQHFYMPRVLAVVDSKPIYDSELKREMQFLKVSENTAFSDITREDVLDRMINDCLILKEAERLKVTVSEQQINEYLKAFWEGISPEEKNQKNRLLSEADWRELVRRRLLVEAVIKKAVNDAIHIGQDEIDEHYWAHLLQFYRQDRVRARQIVVETKEQADALKTRLEHGEKFQDLAKKYSRGPEGEQGGDLGWVEKNDLPQAFSNTLFQMRPGEVSSPVSTPYGYHLFLVEQKERGGRIPLDEARKKIEEDLRVEKSDQAFRVWLENLRAQAVIKVNKE